MKSRSSASGLKKAVVRLRNGEASQGYVNPSHLGATEALEFLTADGTQRRIPLAEVHTVYFVREFGDAFQPQRKTFLSRPKLPGVWVRLKHADGEEIIEGVIENDLLALLDRGIQFTPPDMNGPCVRMFIPRPAVRELTVLGLVGVAPRLQRKPRPAPVPAAQRKLFE